jgi:hypothetical protein
MTDRIPGCICELDSKTGNPVVLGYAMCPIHKPDVVTPLDTAKRLVNKFVDGLDLEMYETHEVISRAKACAIICAQEILAYYLDDQFQYYWNDVIREIENI